MKVINITSEEIMMLRLSAACVDSVKDALQYADSLRAPSRASLSKEVESCETAAKGSTGAQVPFSIQGSVSGQPDCESGQMFKILNSTGLGLACYTSWTDPEQRVELASTAQTTELKFKPQASMVYLPDLARKVCIVSSALCNQSL